MAKPFRVAPCEGREGPASPSRPRMWEDGVRVSSNPSALIVESDADCIACLGEILEEAGYLVSRSGTLRDARAALRSGVRYALVVVGLALPDGDGLALLPDIHARSPGARVVMTGTAGPDIPAGIDLIPGPFSPGDAEAALGLRRRDC